MRKVTYKLWSSNALVSTAALTSCVVVLCDEKPKELLLKISSAGGTADAKIEYAVSPDALNWGSFDDYTDIVASTNAEFTTPEGWTRVPFPDIDSPYLKIKVTGTASNAADTVLSLNLIAVEE